MKVWVCVELEHRRVVGHGAGLYALPRSIWLGRGVSQGLRVARGAVPSCPRCCCTRDAAVLSSCAVVQQHKDMVYK